MTVMTDTAQIADLLKRVKDLEARVNMVRPDTCIYTVDGTPDRSYTSTCGWASIQHADKFCHHCGGRIIIQGEELKK